MLYLSSLDYYYFGLVSYCEGKRRPGSYFKKWKNDRLVRDRKRSVDTGGQREGVQGKDVAPALTFWRGQCANSCMAIDLARYCNSYIEVRFKLLKGIRLQYLLPKLDWGWDGVNRTLLQGTMTRIIFVLQGRSGGRITLKPGADGVGGWRLLSPWLISATP